MSQALGAVAAAIERTLAETDPARAEQAVKAMCDRLLANTVGTETGPLTVITKMLLDQFVYCPIFAVPVTVIAPARRFSSRENPHDGDGFGFPATRQQVHVRGTTWMSNRDGRISTWQGTAELVLSGTELDGFRRDTLGMVLQGRPSTLPVSLQDMAYHVRCAAVGLAGGAAWLIGDLPFGTTPEGAGDTARLAKFDLTVFLERRAGGTELLAALRKWPTGVYAGWYPIKGMEPVEAVAARAVESARAATDRLVVGDGRGSATLVPESSRMAASGTKTTPCFQSMRRKSFSFSYQRSE